MGYAGSVVVFAKTETMVFQHDVLITNTNDFTVLFRSLYQSGYAQGKGKE